MARSEDINPYERRRLISREKRRRHEAESRWLVGVSTGPILFFMWSMPLVLAFDQEWLYQWALDHLVHGLFSGLFLLFGYVVWTDWLGWPLPSLGGFTKLKMEILNWLQE